MDPAINDFKTISLIWGQISVSQDMYFWWSAALRLLRDSFDPEHPCLKADPIHPFYRVLNVFSS